MTRHSLLRRMASCASLLALFSGCERQPLAPTGAITLIATAGATPQTAQVGTAVPVAPAVEARDAEGKPVAGVIIVFVVTSGNGIVNWQQGPTDGTGRLNVSYWNVGMVPGPNTLTALPTNSTSDTRVVFTATGIP